LPAQVIRGNLDGDTTLERVATPTGVPTRRRSSHVLTGRAGGRRSARQSGRATESQEAIMATTSDALRTIALSQVRVPENVRELDRQHVDALARSIALQGLLVPVVVRRSDDGFELVAGFHRIAAAAQLGLPEIPVVVRDVETEESDRAVENIARKQLNPCEEARAVRAMLNRGLTQNGAADVLGWSSSRVAARVKLLALPDRAQEMVGAGVIRSVRSTSCARSVGRRQICSMP
jgi:ParB/RepB/Spo0J family partition protein